MLLFKDEIVHLNNKLEIEKIEKVISKTKTKPQTNNKEDEENDDMLKGLTFNVHISSNDFEAKKNLILPYELIGLVKIIFFKQI